MFRETRINGFHESYYDHACLVVIERDILDTEIKGLTWMSSVRRMWYNLFLLSYSDGRAGNYYYSTHGMRMDRRRHFLRHRYCIHPLSKFRSFWDGFMLLVYIMHKLLLFFNTSIIINNLSKSTYLIPILLEVFMISDIYINTRTGFIDGTGKVILDRDIALLQYCSSKLFFHVVSSIPIASIMFLRYGINKINCGICKANVFNCVISFMTIISLFRVYELSLYWKRNRVTFQSKVFFEFLRIIVIMYLIVIQILHYSDTISLIHMMKTSARTAPHAFFDNLFMYLYLMEKNNTYMLYINAHFWRVVNFLARPNIGMTDMNKQVTYAIIYPHPLLKFIAYGIVTFCVCWLVVEHFYFISRGEYFDEVNRKTERYTMNLIKSRQLPDQISAELREYFNFGAANVKVMEKKLGLSNFLPKVLKDEIIWHCYSRLILRMPYFSDWPKEVIEKLVALVNVQTYLENDLVAEVGVQGVGLMIVEAGMLAVYSSQHTETGHLIDGDYFGEVSLVTDREVRASSVVAITCCKLLRLEKIQFRQVMRSYPHLFYSLQEEIKNKHKSFRSPPQNSS